MSKVQVMHNVITDEEYEVLAAEADREWNSLSEVEKEMMFECLGIAEEDYVDVYITMKMTKEGRI